MSESLDMKAAFEALLPKGSLWKLKLDGDFDRLLQGMGDAAQEVYDFLKTIAWIRDPYKTAILADLEKEYGVLTDTRLSEDTRRQQLAGIKYAVSTTGSYSHMQDNLRAAGFTTLIVTPNDPAIDPDLIPGDLLVNGTIYIDQKPAYLMQASGDFAFAGNAKAVAGYFLVMSRTEAIYNIPDIWRLWRFIFFVGGAASGWPSSPEIESISVDYALEQSLKRLILKYKPMHSWCILAVHFALRFTDGDFENATIRYFWYENILTGPFAADILAARLISGDIYGQFEDDGENFLTAPNDFGVWATVGATVSDNDEIAPDGTLTADTITFTISSNDRIYKDVNGLGDNKDVTQSYFFKVNSGTKDFRLGFRLKDGTFPNSVNLTATTVWQRIDFMQDIKSGGSTPQVLIRNESPGVVGDLIVWGGQVEESIWPTSLMLNTTRDDDEFRWDAAIVPAWLKNEKYALEWIPNAASTDVRGTQSILDFKDDLTGYIIRIYLGSNDRVIIRKFDGGWSTLVQTAFLVFDRKQVMTILLDPDEGSVEVLGATSGGDKVIGISWKDFISDNSDIYFGCNENFAQHIQGFISEPYIYRE